MTSQTAFFYGTLMAPPVLKRVIYGPDLPGSTTRPLSDSITITPAILPSHRRHRVKGADYPAVVPTKEAKSASFSDSSSDKTSATASERSTVRGALVTGLTEGDIYRLDIFEGDEYTRQPVTAYPITSSSAQADLHTEPSPQDLGEPIPCETYIWVAGEDKLDEQEWDFEEFVAQKMWRWAGEGSNDNADIQEVDNTAGDPTGGRNFSAGGGITRQLEESRNKKEVLESAV